MPDEGYHFYPYATSEATPYSQTLVSFESPEGWQILAPTVSADPEEHDGALEHNEPTTWSFKVKIPADAPADQVVSITGGIQLLTCNVKGCDRPTDSKFTVMIPMGTDSAAALEFERIMTTGTVSSAVKAGNYAGAKSMDKELPATEQKTGGSGHAGVKFGEHNVRPDTPEEIAVMARLYQVCLLYTSPSPRD